MQVWPITAQVRRLHLHTDIDFFKRSRKRFVQGGGKPSGNRGTFPCTEQTLFDPWGGVGLPPTGQMSPLAIVTSLWPQTECGNSLQLEKNWLGRGSGGERG